MKTVLVTGGSGLIGKALIKKLLAENFKVRVLSRSPKPEDKVKSYKWDIKNEYIDPEAIKGIDSIIHLAGASIGEEKWTKKRKAEIVNSRVNSANLLFKALSNNSQRLDSFISSSATGFYGAISVDHIFEENDPAHDDFMGKTCLVWEEAADQFTSLADKVVKIRTGLVLSKTGGVLSRLNPLVNYYLGSPLGSGKQYMPWIHIDDLTSIYLKALTDNNFKGTFNAVAAEHINNKEFMSELAGSMGKKIFLPAVPEFVLKIVLGEMAIIVTKGSRVSSNKLREHGFQFEYPNFRQALDSLKNGDQTV